MSRSKKKCLFAFICGLIVLTTYGNAVAQWALDGDAESKARQASMYLSGSGVELDLEKGQELLFESAQLGFGPAQLALGEALLFGNIGLDRNEEQAWYWLNRALEHGLPLAKYYVGQIYYQGRVVPKDIQKAFQFALQAAEEGEPVAYRTVGFSYWNGDGIARNEREAIKWLKRAAESGDIDAIAKLAVTYMYGGDSIEADRSVAIKYLIQGSDGGDPWAQYNLGLAYLEGNGVDQDTKRAIELFSLSATAGDAFAMFDLGKVLLTNLDDDIRDSELGVYWIEKAREEEKFRRYGAQILAKFYEDDIGVTPNYSRAIELYLEADLPLGAANLLFYGDPGTRDIERGMSILTNCHDNNQYGGCATFLGRIYEDISSDLYNPTVARSWFEKGAEAGDMSALLELSDIYALGMGVTPDFHAAATFLDAAIEKNDDPSVPFD